MTSEEFKKLVNETCRLWEIGHITQETKKDEIYLLALRFTVEEGDSHENL